MGFSEYASYASFVSSRHPETVETATSRTWSRHPLGPFVGSFAIRAFRWLGGTGLCCPTAGMVRLMKVLGYQYAGFEIGHVGSCGLNAPGLEESYGL